jgi:hypothetical protein
MNVSKHILLILWILLIIIKPFRSKAQDFRSDIISEIKDKNNFLISSFDCFGFTDKENYQKKKIQIKKSKIKRETVYVYKYKSGKPAEKGMLKSEYKYDIEGDLTNFSYYDSISIKGVSENNIKAGTKKQYYCKDVYKKNKISSGIECEHSQYNYSGTIEKKDILKTGKKSNGLDLEITSYDGNGKTLNKSTLKYDSLNNEIRFQIVNADNKFDKKTIWKIDANKNIIEKVVYKNDSIIIYNLISKYDSNNNKVEEIRYNSEGNIDYNITYRYNADKNKTEETKNNSNNKIEKYKKEYKYDSNKNIIEVIRYTLKGKIIGKTNFKYDANNNLIYTHSLDGFSEDEQTYRYDTRNNIIQEIMNSTNPAFKGCKVFRKFDTNGKLLRYEYNGADKTFICITYSYDNNGNLVERIDYNKKNEPAILTKHVFEY